jgi:MSHA biogenesis protein MshL
MRRFGLTVACLLMLAALGVRAQEPAASGVTRSSADGADARFDVMVENAPAQAFFQGLVEGTQYNMLVHPDVGGRITLRLKHVTLEEVLDATRELYGYDWHRTEGGFLVLPPGMQSRVFHLNYLDLKRYGVSNTRISSGQVTQGGNNTQYGGNIATSGSQQTQSGVDSQGRPLDVTGTTVITRGDSDFWANVESDLHELVGDKPGRTVMINRQSGVIIVHAMPSELREVSEYLHQISRTVTRQVVLEAKIIEVDLNDAYQAGINWATVLSRGSSHYTFGQTTPPQGFAGNALTPTNNPVLIGPASGSTPAVPVPDLTGLASQTLGGAFTLAANFTDFSTLIELLSSQGRTRVLSSPRVSTLHNQLAIIKAGTDQFFVTGVQSNVTSGTGTAITSQNVQLTPFFSGVALDVTPQISDDDSVTLHVHPTISDVTDQVTSLTVNGTVNTLPLALSVVRESDSIVHAHSGQLVIIGGLMREFVNKNAYKTPILGDIPGLGKLFRSDQNQRQTTELVILLRPIIVKDADWATLSSEPSEEIRELNDKAGLGTFDSPTPAPAPASPPGKLDKTDPPTSASPGAGTPGSVFPSASSPGVTDASSPPAIGAGIISTGRMPP